MKVLVLVLALLVVIGAVGVGLAFVLDGIGEQHAGDNAYTITFGHPGGDCADPEAVIIDVDNGQPLFCAAVGGGVGPPINQIVAVPGFSDDQNREITELAESLGAHGLSATAQGQIQDRMNQLAATLAPADRPGHGAVLWGSVRAWTGAGLIIVGIVGFWYGCRRAFRLGNR
jgi:hypothetical protein